MLLLVVDTAPSALNVTLPPLPLAPPVVVMALVVRLPMAAVLVTEMRPALPPFPVPVAAPVLAFSVVVEILPLPLLLMVMLPALPPLALVVVAAPPLAPMLVVVTPPTPVMEIAAPLPPGRLPVAPTPTVPFAAMVVATTVPAELSVTVPALRPAVPALAVPPLATHCACSQIAGGRCDADIAAIAIGTTRSIEGAAASGYRSAVQCDTTHRATGTRACSRTGLRSNAESAQGTVASN